MSTARLWMLNMIFALVAQAPSGEDVSHDVRPDGVHVWEQTTRTEWFGKRLYHFIVGSEPADQKLAAGRSWAFLVGVSEYQNFRQLEFVQNDLEDMRRFLLTQGFDRVYAVLNPTNGRQLVERYMTEEFRQLQDDDRLLFYFSGHGADIGGNTGYILFSGAERDVVSHDVLAINRCKEWSHVIPAGHVLFLFDCCASGLAFTSKAGDSRDRIVKALAGNGSREVITAGTGQQETFGVSIDGRMRSVFTAAFLEAFQGGQADGARDGIITTAETYAWLQGRVTTLSAGVSKTVTPLLWSLYPDEYSGTFLFLSPDASSESVPSHYRQIVIDKSGSGELANVVSLDTTQQSGSVGPISIALGQAVYRYRLVSDHSESRLFLLSFSSGSVPEYRIYVRDANANVLQFLSGSDQATIPFDIDTTSEVPAEEIEIRLKSDVPSSFVLSFTNSTDLVSIVEVLNQLAQRGDEERFLDLFRKAAELSNRAPAPANQQLYWGFVREHLQVGQRVYSDDHLRDAIVQASSELSTRIRKADEVIGDVLAAHEFVRQRLYRDDRKAFERSTESAKRHLESERDRLGRELKPWPRKTEILRIFLHTQRQMPTVIGYRDSMQEAQSLVELSKTTVRKILQEKGVPEHDKALSNLIAELEKATDDLPIFNSSS